MTRAVLRLLLLLCLAVPAAQARTLSGQVVGVSDGDTLTLLVGRKKYKIRLAQIDAPEKSQPWGQRSKQSLSELAFARTVEVEVETEDRYGRLVATVSAGDLNLNLEQIRRGMAWVYVQYPHSFWMRIEEWQARHDQRGLWSDEDPVPPWEWRRARRPR